MSGVNIEQVKDYIKSMTLMDAAKLVKDLEEELGVSAAAPVGMMAAMPMAGAAGGAAAAEQTEFTVTLVSAGAEKLKVIKVVRELNSSLGLKEAKELVDNPPKVLKEAVSKADADNMKAKLEEVGAKVEIK